MNDHLRPHGNPAPPRPRSPDFLTSSVTASGVIDVTALRRARYPPEASYPARVKASGLSTFRVRMRSIMSRSLEARQKTVDRVVREVLVVVVVQLEHWGGAARAEALHAHERELPVGSRLPRLDAELALEVPHELVGASEHARQ